MQKSFFCIGGAFLFVDRWVTEGRGACCEEVAAGSFICIHAFGLVVFNSGRYSDAGRVVEE